MQKFAVSILLVLVILLVLPSEALAAVTITSHSTNTNSVGRYKKFEVTFQLSRTFPADSFLPYYYYDASDTPAANPGRNSPYGVDGISVDGVFISPSGKQIKVPAFYHEQYSKSGSTLTPSGNFSWKLRFAPEEVGEYQFYITVEDKSGTSRYPAQGSHKFQAVESNSSGFIRQSNRDVRFLEFSNGKSFIPNSSGHQWWEHGKGRTDDYIKTFADFKNHGINFTRIWDQNDGYALTVEGTYDAYKFPDDYNPVDNGINIGQIPKGTRMNQRGNFEEDLIIEAAEQNGVYIQLCSKNDPYWLWDASIHNESWNNTRVEFDNKYHLNYWKRNFRYRVARWGYSTAVMGWETWNEHGHVPTNSSVYRFYQEFANYQRQTDPYKHLITTSQGSQAWSPSLWDSPAFDVANYHDYMMTSRYSDDLAQDATNFVYRVAQCLRTSTARDCGMGIGDGSSWSPNKKPIIWGELDTGTSSWNTPNPQARGTHNMRWAGLFSPIGMSPVDWYFEAQGRISNFITNKYKEAKIASDYFADIDYSGAHFTYLSTSDVRVTSTQISATHAKMRVLAMRAQDNQQLYAWVQHKDHIWKNSSNNPAAISGTFSVSGMQNGQYNIEYWDTYNGNKTTSTANASNGSITIPVNSLSKDIAIKIRHVDYVPDKPVSPTPTTGAGSAACGSDINQDGQVNLVDYSVLVTNFFNTNLSNPRVDISKDGVVDLSDYSILSSNFLKTCTW